MDSFCGSSAPAGSTEGAFFENRKKKTKTIQKHKTRKSKNFTRNDSGNFT